MLIQHEYMSYYLIGAVLLQITGNRLHDYDIKFTYVQNKVNSAMNLLALALETMRLQARG